VLSEQGRGAEGLAEIRDGLCLFAGMSDELFRPYYLAKLADALARSGHVAEGLMAVDEVIESYRRVGVPYWDAELQRRRGEILLAANLLDRAAAEACFRRAIEIAQDQSARSLELRAATSLARLLAEQGKWRQAHDLLAPIYGWFSEGFGTADLHDAKALLQELR
jgi:predicted ATPase